MSEVVITVKGGPNHGEPWIVLHAASTAEAAAMVAEANALIDGVRALNNAFQDQQRKQAIGLLQSELGATVVESTAAWTEPATPVTNPWDQAAPSTQAPNPFGGGSTENPFGAASPSLRSPVVKNLPRVPEWDKNNWKDPQSPEGKQIKAVKDYCYKAGSKLKWEGGRGGFGFETPPSAETLAYLRQNLPAIGAMLEE